MVENDGLPEYDFGDSLGASYLQRIGSYPQQEGCPDRIVEFGRQYTPTRQAAFTQMETNSRSLAAALRTMPRAASGGMYCNKIVDHAKLRVTVNPEFYVIYYYMPLQKYMWIFLIFPRHFSCAQSKNDSVFSAATLSSVPLMSAMPQLSKLSLSAPALACGFSSSFLLTVPICQGYTRTLNQLNQQYAGKIKVYGIIPGKTWKTADVKAFAGKYHILYPLWMDRSLSLSHYLQASTTPEAILLTTGNVLVYKGAIDNWYKSLGRSRNKPTQNYLQDAIDQALSHAHPVIKRTTPVGCLINDF